MKFVLSLLALSTFSLSAFSMQQYNILDRRMYQTPTKYSCCKEGAYTIFCEHQLAALMIGGINF